MRTRPSPLSIAVLGLSHAVHDGYLPFLGVLMHFMVPHLGISLAQAGTLVAVFSLTAALGQPLSGYLTDRTGWLGFTAISLPLTAVAMSSIGLWNTSLLVAVAVAVGGLSSAIYHPQGAALAASLGGDRRGLAVAVFMATGVIGIAGGPVVVLTLVETWGLRATALAALPALILTPLVFRYVPWKERLATTGSSRDLTKALRRSWRPLSTIWLIVVLRSSVILSLASFLGVYLTGVRLMDESMVKWAMFVFLLTEGVGSLSGGYLSDRLGRRVIITSGLLLGIAPLALFLLADGIWMWISLAAMGALLSLPMPVLIVRAQETVAGGIATASGLMMGAGMATGGLLVSVVGYIADIWGLDVALGLTSLLLLGAAALSLAVDRERAVRLRPGEATVAESSGGSGSSS